MENNKSNLKEELKIIKLNVFATLFKSVGELFLKEALRRKGDVGDRAKVCEKLHRDELE